MCAVTLPHRTTAPTSPPLLLITTGLTRPEAADLLASAVPQGSARSARVPSHGRHCHQVLIFI
jgi:hypothetical protein